MDDMKNYPYIQKGHPSQMSNKNRKAKATTMTDEKLRKAKKRLVQLEEQVRAARMSQLNMRQLYEMVAQKLASIQSELDQTVQVVVAMIIQDGTESRVVTADVLPRLEDYVGYELALDGDDLVVTAVRDTTGEEE